MALSETFDLELLAIYENVEPCQAGVPLWTVMMLFASGNVGEGLAHRLRPCRG